MLTAIQRLGLTRSVINFLLKAIGKQYALKKYDHFTIKILSNYFWAKYIMNTGNRRQLVVVRRICSCFSVHDFSFRAFKLFGITCPKVANFIFLPKSEPYLKYFALFHRWPYTTEGYAEKILEFTLPISDICQLHHFYKNSTCNFQNLI